MTPWEALARIAALCDGFQTDGHGDAVSITAVRAVLAEVTPEPGGTLDRDQARNALIWMQQNGGLDMYGWDDCLDRLAACVRPATIDRDDLRALLDERFRLEHEADDDDVDSIIRLIEPVAAVTLSPEEAARAAGWYYGQADDIIVDDSDRALAARLEATQ